MQNESQRTARVTQTYKDTSAHVHPTATAVVQLRAFA